MFSSRIQISFGVLSSQEMPLGDLYILTLCQLLPSCIVNERTKYHQVAIRESLSDHALMLARMVLVIVVFHTTLPDVGNQSLPKAAYPLDHQVSSVGGIIYPSHDHEAAVIENPSQE